MTNTSTSPSRKSRRSRSALIGALCAPIAFSTLAVAVQPAANAAEVWPAGVAPVSDQLEAAPGIDPMTVLSGIHTVGKLVYQGQKNVDAGLPFFDDAATAEAKKVNAKLDELAQQMELNHAQVNSKLNEIGKQIADSDRRKAYEKVAELIQFTRVASVNLDDVVQAAELVNTGKSIQLHDEYGNLGKTITPRVGKDVPPEDDFQIQVVNKYKSTVERLLQNSPGAKGDNTADPIRAAFTLYSGIGGEMGNPTRPGFLGESWKYQRHVWAPKTAQNEATMNVYPGAMRREMNDLTTYYQDLQSTFAAVTIAYLQLEGKSDKAAEMKVFAEDGSKAAKVRGLDEQWRTFGLSGFTKDNEVVVEGKGGTSVGLSNQPDSSPIKKNQTINKATLDFVMNSITDSGAKYSQLSDKLPSALPKEDWLILKNVGQQNQVKFTYSTDQPFNSKTWYKDFTKLTQSGGENKVIKVQIHDSKPSFPLSSLKSYEGIDFEKGWNENVQSAAEPAWVSYNWTSYYSSKSGYSTNYRVGPGLFVEAYNQADAPAGANVYAKSAKAQPDYRN